MVIAELVLCGLVVAGDDESRDLRRWRASNRTGGVGSKSKAAWNHGVLEKWLLSHHDYWLDGDETLGAHWRHPDMPDGDVVWSARQRAAVRRALASDSNKVGKWWPLPRVFVYPYPSEFADPEKLSALNVSLKNGSRASFTRYFELTYGRSFSHESLEPTSDGATWTPPLYGVGDYRERGNTKQNTLCDDLEAKASGASGDELERLRGVGEAQCVSLVSSQHNLGVVVHRGLVTSYPNLVSKPEDAELFFIPDYFDTTRQFVKLEEYCRVAGPAWKKHLARFVSSDGVSYAERREMRDHFVVVARAWHSGDKKLDASGVSSPSFRRAKVGDCGYHAAWMPHRLQLEVQNPLVRACARAHPVPYASFLFWSDRVDWGRAWWQRKTQSPKPAPLIAAFFNEGETKDHVRTLLKHQCKDEPDACYMPPANVHGHFNRSGLEDAYRGATFSLQPPGVTAARKGIVDSILAGAVPVLLRGADNRDNDDDFAAHDQRDMWPWNWPGQGASCIAVTEADVKHRGVVSLLRKVDSDQLALMRAVLRRTAPGMAWPLDTWLAPSQVSNATTPRRRPNALELAMHHLGAVAKRSIADDKAATQKLGRHHKDAVARNEGHELGVCRAKQ
ncbi:hypothetical protein CTAYLR_007146 [Chrysophaeum taylorii]|uniref:Exostosin GT47 domain-containing protein n=1 Tax=Chrysophaeum taylorii TaxID=2483200 RepID=A0AAD7UL89_9STRA|nr:hypothetical protein CTAYLR_007146 [Chrysophaeum taylorii]